ncbi:MAG: hypothetical protein R2788_03350 [Saprospiraceae bacterium]
MLNLTGNELAFSLAWEGGYKKNTLRSLAAYNPYILHTRLTDKIINTRYFNVYGSIQGNFPSSNILLRSGTNQP